MNQIKRLFPQLPNFYMLPGKTVSVRKLTNGKDLSNSKDLLSGKDLFKTIQPSSQPEAEEHRKAYMQMIPTLLDCINKHTTQAEIQKFIHNPLMDKLASDPDMQRGGFKKFLMQDYVFLKAMVKAFDVLIKRMPSKTEDEKELIKFEEGRLDNLRAYAGGIKSYALQMGAKDKDIDDEVANEKTAEYIADFTQIAYHEDHFHWLCFMVACAAGWNEGARHWSQEKTTIKKGHFWDIFILPSLKDDYTFTELLDNLPDEAAIKKKSPLYPEIVDNYGNTVLKPENSKDYIELHSASLDQWLGGSIGSQARKIGILIEMYIRNAPEAKRQGMMDDCVKYIGRGYERETNMWASCFLH